MPVDQTGEDVVGAYGIAVLEGGTIEGVMTWLGDNGYQQDPASEPILGEYLAEGFMFVALELTVNRRSKSERPAGPPAERAGREAAEF